MRIKKTDSETASYLAYPKQLPHLQTGYSGVYLWELLSVKYHCIWRAHVTESTMSPFKT